MARDFTYLKLSAQDRVGIAEDEVRRLERRHYQRRIERQQLVDAGASPARIARIDEFLAVLERDRDAAAKMIDKPE